MATSWTATSSRSSGGGDAVTGDDPKPYFLVLSQAKTGTTTLEETLSSVVAPGTYLGRFHDHRLRPVDPASMTPKKLAVHRRNLATLDRIRGLDPKSERLVVVTAVRDPVARMYSHFFEKRVYPSDLLQGTEAGDWSIRAFVDAFEPAFRAYLQPLLQGEQAYLQDILNDGLAQEFPNLGFEGIPADLVRFGPHARYASGGVIGLLLSSNALADGLRAALPEFGVDPCNIVETVAYSNRERGFAGLYRGFMDNVPFPGRMLELAYRSPLLQLLHSPQEITAMRRRWADRWRTKGGSE